MVGIEAVWSEITSFWSEVTGNCGTYLQKVVENTLQMQAEETGMQSSSWQGQVREMYFEG